MSVAVSVAGIAKPIIEITEDWGSSVVNLGLRLYLAEVFFTSGMTKIQSWDTTLMLFEYEYSVPLLSPSMAAYLGTGAELVLPILLVLGLGGRFAAVALFIFNIVAVISYPTLNDPGKVWHYLWGLAFVLPILFGPGKLSVDHILRKKFMRS